LNVSEQQAEPISAESGSLNAEPMGPHLPETKTDPVAASASELTSEVTRVESPDLAPEQSEAVEPETPKMALPKAGEFKVEGFKAEAPKLDVPKADALKADALKADALKADALKADAPKPEAPKADAPRATGKIMIMSAGDHHGWDSHDSAPEPESQPASGMFGKRRFSALAAVVALAAIAGALGGALATASLGHFAGGDTAAAATGSQALEASVARIDADVLALKAGVAHMGDAVERTSKLNITQFKQTSDRLDKVEKAQAEPAAKLAKLSEAVEKLHATPAAPAPVAAAAPVASKEVTGSVSATVAPPKVELARLPTVDNWVLRDVANGGALIEGRQGIFEVFAGDVVPGLGRVDAVRRQDGRWVVVTSKGLIVAR
jgi:hypothetical protein